MPYRLELMNKSIERFTKKYPNIDTDGCIKLASECEFETFCDLCTYAYRQSMSMKRDIDSTKVISALNGIIYKHLGEDAYSIYKAIENIHKYERCRGDCIYEVFAHVGKPHEESTLIKSTVEFMVRFNNKKLNSDNIYDVYSLIHNGSSSALALEVSILDTDKKRDMSAKRHMARWHQFCFDIWNGDFASAYSIIEIYNDELAKLFERKYNNGNS